MDIFELIDAVEQKDISVVFDAVLSRYKQLFPEWEMVFFTLDKTKNKNEQLDRIIDFLNHLKEQ